ncbi:glycerol kinase GlpK [Paenibacillus phytohabitans]|uniref:glycerol kinase GlpK n=1 Tax=Paenibacillus phytohabitans TaxID=2654978 RepID=UPI003007F6B8
MGTKKNYILTVDQSTSGTKVLLVDQQGVIIERSSMEHRQYYPRPGWVEHDPLEIYDNVLTCIAKVLEQSNVSAEDLAALTITNQRETAVMWDKKTGKPVYNAIVWQCQRTAEVCQNLKDRGFEEKVRSKTGLLLDPYFSASKFKWIIDYIDEAPRLLNESSLLAGTIDSWLVWKLTGGLTHVSDYTNASRTSLFNIHTLQWDEEMADLFGVPTSILPEVKASDAVVGYTAVDKLFSTPVPIAGIIGDSQGALFGHLCFEPGTVKATYGTGTSVLMNVGEKPVNGGPGLVTAIAWGAGGKITYALEAVIRSSGDSIKWTRDNLELFTTFDEMQVLIDELPSNEGVYLIPAFVGLGVPYWDPSAQAAITGMNRGTRKAHIVRAAIESIAYQVRDAVEFMQERTTLPLQELRTDGGASSNPWLMQFQADILNRSVTRSNCPELSALGSVYLGGLATGFWMKLDHIALNEDLYETFQPKMAEDTRESYYTGWKNAVRTIISSSAPA